MENRGEGDVTFNVLVATLTTDTVCFNWITAGQSPRSAATTISSSVHLI